MFDIRDGERRLPFDPSDRARDAGLVFIGHIVSPWTQRSDCPKNMDEARARCRPAEVHVAPAYREGLAGLERFAAVVVLTFFPAAPRDLIVQRPRHLGEARGVFALRSPARPNPIGLHVARLLAVDAAAGIVHIEGIDVLDGTPVIDLKPYRPEADRPGDPAP